MAKKFSLKQYRRLLPAGRFISRDLPRIAKLPFVKPLLPLMELINFGLGQKDKTQVFTVPLNAEVPKNKKGAVVPFKLLEEAIEQASYQVIWYNCWCREASHCKNYPIDHGCLFLGKAALHLVDAGVAREVSKKEAKEHLKKAGEYGLVPLAAYVTLEQKIFGIPKDQHENFLEICLCCPCCCIGMNLFPYITERNRWRIQSVGFTAKATPECQGCGKCIDICPLNAVKRKGDKVWVNEDICIGCGYCQNVCDFDAIKLVHIGRDPGGILAYFKGLNLDLTKV